MVRKSDSDYSSLTTRTLWGTSGSETQWVSDRTGELRQGALHRAIPVLERALALCQSTNLPRFFPLISASLGTAYALAGRAAEALPLLNQMVERLASGSRTFLHALLYRAMDMLLWLPQAEATLAPVS